MSEHTSNDAVVEMDPDKAEPSVDDSPADLGTRRQVPDTKPGAGASEPATPDPVGVSTEEVDAVDSGPGGSRAGADAADEADADGDESDGDESDEDDDDEADGDGPEGRERSEDPLDAEGEIAADYLEELLDIADLDGDIDTYVESGRAHVSIVTDSHVLVGKDGEVLEALQDLVRLAVVAETGHRSRLMLDVAGHRDKRRRELVDLAGDAVEEVRSSSEAVRLSPMNPFERKIVHDAVAAAGLTSESEGEEPQRRVVVLP